MPGHKHNIVLIGVVASRLVTSERRRFFDCMLSSVLAQTRPLDAIYVGLSGVASTHCVFPLPMPVTCTLRRTSFTQGQVHSYARAGKLFLVVQVDTHRGQRQPSIFLMMATTTSLPPPPSMTR